MLSTELSADARAVADLLIACPIDGTVTLADMSAAIGRDITRRRHIIATACRVAEREAGAVFASVRKVGYKRLDAERAVAVVGPSARKHIARSARRASRSISAAMDKANDLPMDVRRRAVHELGVLGIIEHAARERVKTLREDAATKPEPVAVVAQRWLARMTGGTADVND
jgi:NADH dehydrogenase/NADH:ubiquinone oxidoreductase subunit G